MQIGEFFGKLGFKVDETGIKTFTSKMTNMTKKVKEATTPVTASFDKMSKEIQKTGRNVTSTVSQIVPKLEQVTQKTRTWAEAPASVDRGFRRVVVGINLALRDLERFDNKLVKVQERMQKKFQGLRTMGEGMAGAGQASTFGVSTPLAIGGGIAINEALKIDDTVRGFTALSQSAEVTDQIMNRIAQSANKYGFGIKAMRESILNMYMKGIPENEVVDTFERISAFTRGNVEMTNRFVNQLIQIKAKGKSELEDLKTMSEAGFTMADLAKSIGVSTKRLYELSSEGKITFEMVNKAIKDTTNQGGRLGNVLSGMMDAPSSKIRRSLNQLNETMVKFGELLLPVLVDVLDIITPILTKFNAMPDSARKIVLGLGFVAVALGPILMLAGNLLIVFTKVASLFGSGGLLTTALSSGGWLVRGLTLAQGVVTTIAGAFSSILALLIPLGMVVFTIAFVFEKWDVLVASLKANLQSVVDLLKMAGNFFTGKGFQTEGMDLAGMAQREREQNTYSGYKWGTLSKGGGKYDDYQKTKQLNLNSTVNLSVPNGTPEQQQAMLQASADKLFGTGAESLGNTLLLNAGAK